MFIGRKNSLILISTCLFICFLIYFSIDVNLILDNDVSSIPDGGCCQGVEGLELMGPVVKPGSHLKVNSSNHCCQACKATCDDEGFCLCDAWVYCGDSHNCGPRIGQCLLKRQYDLLDPDWTEARDSDNRFWTSGFVFGKVEAIVKMERKYGPIRIKLLPECSPRTYIYILELLASRHCVGCKFYRAEKGDQLPLASYEHPFAFIQGSLEAEGVEFKKMPSEACSAIQRGTVAWIGSGPEFFISLANHHERKKTYSVIGHVVAEDMKIVEKIATLPTVPDVWNNVNAMVLEKPVRFWFQRINKCEC